MKLNGNSLDEVLMKETLSDEDIVFLLGLTEPEDCKKLQEAAYKKTTELMGNKVYYRGLIEVSNVCTVDCRYCGIRKDNYGVHRYTLSKEEILEAAMLLLKTVTEAFAFRPESVMILSLSHLFQIVCVRFIERQFQKVFRTASGSH